MMSKWMPEYGVITLFEFFSKSQKTTSNICSAPTPAFLGAVSYFFFCGENRSATELWAMTFLLFHYIDLLILDYA